MFFYLILYIRVLAVYTWGRACFPVLFVAFCFRYVCRFFFVVYTPVGTYFKVPLLHWSIVFVCVRRTRHDLCT